jgi:succinyl-diaminopimelate desuccinylase
MLNPTEVDLVAKALAWFDSHRGEYVEDLKRWIRIPSVSDVSQAAQGAPYGPGVSAMFEEIADTAQAYGFQSRNHEGYAMSVFARDVQWPLSKDIAVLSHADVVPAGPGWLSDPFDPYEREGYVVGRGARDDKAMCVLGMFLLRFFDDERLAFSHPLRLMYGGAEETGLHDMEHYVAAHGAPYRTVVTDCAFPVNYAQKGEVVVTAALPLPEHVESIRAGVAPNAVAGEAVLALSDVDGERLRSALSGADTAGGSFEFSVEADGGVSIKAVGRSAHAAGPQDGVERHACARCHARHAGVRGDYRQ